MRGRSEENHCPFPGVPLAVRLHQRPGPATPHSAESDPACSSDRCVTTRRFRGTRMYSKARFALSALTTAILTAVALDLPASEQHSNLPMSPTAPTSAVDVASGLGVPAVTAEQKARDAYGKLPLAFVPNAGQTDARVRFSAQAAGAAFYFTPEEAVFAFRKGSPSRPGSRSPPRLPGCEPGDGDRGAGTRDWQGQLPDRERPERSGAPTFPPTGRSPTATSGRASTWSSAATRSRLKYEFLLAPGAKVEEIRLAYGGAERLSVDEAGQLLIRTPLGTLTRRRAPSATRRSAAGACRSRAASSFAADARTRRPTASRVGAPTTPVSRS